VSRQAHDSGETGREIALVRPLFWSCLDVHNDQALDSEAVGNAQMARQSA
jgi:hypothetical protein